MAFNGNEGEQITLDEAIELTTNYRDSGTAYGAKAHFMGKTILLSILNQTGCVGIRTYYGIDADGNKELVIVGVNSSEKDMTSGIIADRQKPCPTYCDTTSPLQG